MTMDRSTTSTPLQLHSPWRGVIKSWLNFDWFFSGPKQITQILCDVNSDIIAFPPRHSMAAASFRTNSELRPVLIECFPTLHYARYPTVLLCPDWSSCDIEQQQIHQISRILIEFLNEIFQFQFWSRMRDQRHRAKFFWLDSIENHDFTFTIRANALWNVIYFFQNWRAENRKFSHRCRIVNNNGNNGNNNHAAPPTDVIKWVNATPEINEIQTE